jgi:hypothetical protein
MVRSASGAQLSNSNPNVARTAPTADASDEVKEAFVADAAACIREHGLVILENVIPVAAVEDMLAHFTATYDSYMRPGQTKLFRNFQDDPKRAQIPVAPTGVMANPVVFANPTVMSLVRHFIGDQAIVGEMGGVISHPGSRRSRFHCWTFRSNLVPPNIGWVVTGAAIPAR